MLVLRHVKNRIMEKHGKSEGHLLCNQAGEIIVVALMRGISAKLLEGSTHAEQLVNAPSEQDPDTSNTKDSNHLEETITDKTSNELGIPTRAASPQDSGQHAASMITDTEQNVTEDRRPALELTLPSRNVRQLTVSPPRPLANKTT